MHGVVHLKGRFLGVRPEGEGFRCVRVCKGVPRGYRLIGYARGTPRVLYK